MVNQADLAKMRLDYETTGLAEADLAAEPIRQFEHWLDEAVAAEVEEPNAMVVSSVDEDGQPWSRFVLLKAIDGDGFVFFTNYESNKSQQLEHNPKIAVTFGWLELHRQVCIAGAVEMVSADESDEYWAVRTRGSQVGGWASAQSRELADRQQLLDQVQGIEDRFPDEVPRPPHWGGWRVVPHTIEFWQGRQNRLHDRLRYRQDSNGNWSQVRLSP